MKVVRHSHHEQFLRLANDDAALLVSSGRWVYTSKFEARKATQHPARSLPFRIFMFVTTLAMIIAALLLSTSARAADKPVPKAVPYKVCLTQPQARQVYPGQHLKYREVQGERCWFAGKTLPKSAFIVKVHPRATGVAVAPTRLDTDVQARVQGPDSSSLSAGAIAQYEQESGLAGAIAALCGEPCPSMLPFEAMWARTMRDVAGVR